MLCNIDEFLLVLQNWMTASTSVDFLLILFDAPREPLLSVQLVGTVAGIDDSLPGFSFSTESRGLVIVNLNHWPQLGYADKSALPVGTIWRSRSRSTGQVLQ
jgi:hypothetical protein